MKHFVRRAFITALVLTAAALVACGPSKPKQGPAKPAASGVANETEATLKYSPEYTRYKKASGKVSGDINGLNQK